MPLSQFFKPQTHKHDILRHCTNMLIINEFLSYEVLWKFDIINIFPFIFWNNKCFCKVYDISCIFDKEKDNNMPTHFFFYQVYIWMIIYEWKAIYKKKYNTKCPTFSLKRHNFSLKHLNFFFHTFLFLQNVQLFL